MAYNPVISAQQGIDDLRRAAALLEEAETQQDPYNAIRMAESILCPALPRDDGMWEAGCGLVVLSRIMDNFGSQMGTRWAIRATRLNLLLDARIRDFWQGRRVILEYDVGTTSRHPIICKNCGQGMGSMHTPGCPHERCPECGHSGGCQCLNVSLGHVVSGVLANRE